MEMIYVDRIENIKDILLIGRNLIIDRGGQNKEIMLVNNLEKMTGLLEFLKAFGLEMRVRVI